MALQAQRRKTFGGARRRLDAKATRADTSFVNCQAAVNAAQGSGLPPTITPRTSDDHTVTTNPGHLTFTLDRDAPQSMRRNSPTCRRRAAAAPHGIPPMPRQRPWRRRVADVGPAPSFRPDGIRFLETISGTIIRGRAYRLEELLTHEREINHRGRAEGSDRGSRDREQACGGQGPALGGPESIVF